MTGTTTIADESGPVLDPEDAKLVVLARSSRARTGAAQGGAVRDGDGRTYVATSVNLNSLRLDALQVAIAMAVSSGAATIEAAAVVSGPDAKTHVKTNANTDIDVADMADVSAGAAAIRELAGSNVTIIAADQNGAVVRVSRT